ncbi:helix-turn-helix domain-containing protein [Streptomyces narbonensis]|uniref:helix-turn-helix domain-containing protein n=1 Tax=Streptomyces narbonensis TaxID=67333 RepID=UPI003F53FDF3
MSSSASSVRVASSTGASPKSVSIPAGRVVRVFLAHDCSWARTGEALHVNTVHYRVERIEALTGPGPVAARPQGGPVSGTALPLAIRAPDAVRAGRCARSSTSPGRSP